MPKKAATKIVNPRRFLFSNHPRVSEEILVKFTGGKDIKKITTEDNVEAVTLVLLTLHFSLFFYFFYITLFHVG
jgi:hypothetical protein